MKRACLFIFTLLIGLFIFLPVSNATYPGKSFAHWDPTLSDEYKDPDYQTIADLVKEKKYDEATALLDKKIQSVDDKSTPVILKGFIANERGNYKEALKLFLQGRPVQKAGIPQSPHPAIHFGFCQVYRNLGIIILSAQGCQVAVERQRNSPEVHYEYAQTLTVQGKMQAALRELQIAAKLDPKNPKYPFESGMASNYLNAVEDAEKYFLQALSLDPENIDAAYEVAYLYTAQGKSKEAEKYIYRILETRKAHPKVASAKLLLGYANKNAADKLSLKVVPHEYHLSRSKSLYQSGQYGLSLVEVQTAARLKPEDFKIKEILIGISTFLFRLDTGENTINEFLELVKDNDLLKAKAYQKLGDIRIIQGKLLEARKFYETAQTFGDPGDLAKTSLAQFPELSSADLSLQSPSEIFIKPTNALNRQGEIFAHYKMYDRAIAIYSMVMRMDPQHLESMLNTATAYFNSDNNGRTISILERLLVTHPNHDHILSHRFLLAKAYVKHGDIKGGLKNLQWIVEKNPAIKTQIQSDPVFKTLKENKEFKKIIP
jgi:tetratricopeptide (TPR) repeat protein